MTSIVGEFLRDHGARRAGGYHDAPDFYGAARAEEAAPPGFAPRDPDATPVCDWRYEMRDGIWDRIVVRNAARLDPADPLTPCRFVDGKDVGRVVAYVASPQGFPVPVRLSQVGAVALRGVGCLAPGEKPGTALRVESRRVENVVSFMADLFPWDEVERFAAGLHAGGFRLLISKRLGEGDDPRDVGYLQNNVKYRTREEMFRLERRAAAPALAAGTGTSPNAPVTLVDGRLDDKEEIVRGTNPVIGLIKTHSSSAYLHEEGWDILYALRPGERTPAIGLKTEKLSLVTWYVRLCDGDAGGPFDGVVRVEMSRAFFEISVQGNFDYLDRLSHSLCAWRTRDSGYGRAGVTLHPIQQAEERLRAHFQSVGTLTNRFYTMSDL